MRFNLKKGLVATSLALAFGSFGAAHAADTISFDPDGTGGANDAFLVGAFDWAVASAIADNSVSSPTDFNLYFHAALNGFQDVNGDPAGSPTGLNTSFEITVIGGFHESISITSISTPTLVSDGGDGLGGGNDVYSITTNANLNDVDSKTEDSFIRVFYDDLTDASGSDSSSLAGTGYDDGLLILSAHLFDAVGTIASTQQFRDVNDNGIFDAGDVPLGTLLDNFGVDNWAGLLTVNADGSTSLTATIDFFHTDFFKTALAQIAQDLDFTTETNVPFDQTNPSKCFDTDGTTGGGGVVGLTAAAGGCDAAGGMSLGTINGGFLGGQGNDFLLQADASNSFVAAVPEPGILSLLGLSLMGLALSRRPVRK